MKTVHDNKIHEIEESLKLLARHMKEESSRLEALIKSGAGDKKLMHELDDIKKRLDEHTEPMTTDTERKLQAEVLRLEEMIHSIPKEKMIKEYSESLKVADELKKSVEMRMSIIESKMKNATHDIVSSRMEELNAFKEKFRRLEGRVNDSVSIVDSIIGSKNDEVKRVEKRMSERIEVLEDHTKKGTTHESTEYAKLSRRIDDIQDNMEKGGHSDSKEYKNLMGQMHEFREDFSSKVKHFQRKEDFMKMLGDIDGRFKDFESELRKVDMKKSHEYSSHSHDHSPHAHTSNAKEVDVEGIRKGLEEDMRKTLGKFSAEMEEMHGKLEHDSSAATKADISKISGELMNVVSRVSEIENSVDKRVASFENNRGEEPDIMDLRVDFNDIDKRLVEIELVMKDLRKTEAETRKALEHMQNFDRDTKMEATKLLTSQLSEFAKYVDRRLPDVVPRDEFTRAMIEINHKISTVETPDFSRLGRRMQSLEGKMNEIYDLLRAFSDSVPVVVE